MEDLKLQHGQNPSPATNELDDLLNQIVNSRVVAKDKMDDYDELVSRDAKLDKSRIKWVIFFEEGEGGVPNFLRGRCMNWNYDKKGEWREKKSKEFTLPYGGVGFDEGRAL